MDYLDYYSVSGLNLYAYCNNNPVMHFDGDGHMPKWLKWTLEIRMGIVIVAASICTAGTAIYSSVSSAIGFGGYMYMYGSIPKHRQCAIKFKRTGCFGRSS